VSDVDGQLDIHRDRSRSRRSEERYRALFDTMDQGVCVCEMILDAAGDPVDYRFLEVNHLFAEMTGLQNAVGRTARELVPQLEDHWFELYGRVALTGEPIRFIQNSDAMGRWFEVGAFRVGDPDERTFAILFTDITRRRRAEAAVLEAQSRFRTFADTAPAMLWVTEVDGSCSFLSRGWYEFTGQSEETGLGFGWLDAVHPDDRETSREAFLQATRQAAPFSFEHRIQTRHGTYRWVIDAGRPRLGADGSFLGFTGSVIDIHDRKQAEERLDMVVNSSEIGLWYCDLPFDELIWNAKVKEHFGLPPDATVTIDTFYDRIHPDDRARTREAIEASITNHTTYDTQYRTIGADGRIRWIRAIGGATYDSGRPIRFDGVTIDITELVTLRESAEAASRAKDEFLAMLGHELRNPLAPILTALQLLKLRGIDEAAHERGVIERQVQHLVSLVDDLLDVSRITRGRVDLRREPVELATVVTRAVEIAAPVIDQQRHALHVDVPAGLFVHGDAGRLGQVVSNLLTNAAKYTDPEGVVAVVGWREGADAVLSVRDSGVGIEPEMLARIFELFVQEPQSLARSQGGLGLGLAIVRSLVDLHGGTVEVRSEGRGRGSEFLVRLPALDRSVDSGTPSAARPGALSVGSSGRVLVVDHDRDAAEAIRSVLAAAGWDVHVAGDANTAITEALALLPDVALVATGLPVVDGHELARRFAEHPQLRAMRLVALDDDPRQRRRGAAGSDFDAHLVRPVAVEQLQAILLGSSVQ
jgi:PAS domain S-box-containing protein